MAAETIQEFLVALSYKMDGSSERRFTESLAKAKVAALALGATLTGLVATIEKVAAGYEQLYYQSQRVGASVANIQAFSYALSQVGGSAAGAAASLESIGNFLRSSPGAEGFLNRLGIQTRDANGGLRDTTAQLEQFFRVARTMPYYRAKAYAGVLGIDERTLQAGMRGLGDFSDQLKAMYRAAGVDSQAAAAGSAKFMQQLRGLGAALQVLRDKVAISLERGVGGMIDRLRRMLVDNFGRISTAIVGVSKFIIALGWNLMQLVGRAADLVARLVDWFNGLDQGTRRWTEGIALLAAGWYLLNKGFLASPLGRIVALGAALLLLYDDYKTFKAGGKTLIDWKEWEPGINATLDSIKAIKAAFQDMWPSIHGYLTPLMGFLKHELVQGMKEAMADVTDLVQAVDDSLHGRWGSARAHLAAIATREAASTRDDATALGGLVGSEAAVAGIPNPLGATRGIRNNNPLNLSYMAGQGALGSDGRFGRYASMADGIAATTRQLVSYRNRGIDTVASIIRKWAPESENGSDAGYIADVAKWSGLDPNAHIDVRNVNVAQRLIAAMGRHESGLIGRGDDIRSGVYAGLGGGGLDSRIANSIGADHQRFGALDPALKGLGSGGARVHAPMNTTINVHGAGQPEQVAQSVARKQDWVAASLVRNMGPLAY